MFEEGIDLEGSKAAAGLRVRCWVEGHSRSWLEEAESSAADSFACDCDHCRTGCCSAGSPAACMTAGRLSQLEKVDGCLATPDGSGWHWDWGEGEGEGEGDV